MTSERQLALIPRALPGRPALGRLRRRLKALGTTGEHWARVVMNERTRALVQGISPGSLDALEISGNGWKEFPFRSYTNVEYPSFDICNSPLDERFGLIIAEQVFEHLLWPYRAGRNVFEMLEPGGYFLLTTPFLLRVHDTPVDCTRWTETGIRYFLAECGFDLARVQTGSWGNRACIVANFRGWTLYRPRIHSLDNEPEFPVVVWALAQKPSEPGPARDAPEENARSVSGHTR